MSIRYLIDKCPVCKTDCTTGAYDHGEKKEVICDRCGKFKISLWGLESSEIRKYRNGFAILSYYIRNFYNPEDLLDRDKINSMLDNTLFPTFKNKFKLLLSWLANVTGLSTKSVTGNPNNLSALIGAIDGKEVLEILDEIWRERLIEVEHPAGESLRESEPSLGFQVHLTAKGIKRINEIKNSLNKVDNNTVKTDYKYDIVLSFAGEDRKFVEKITECLNKTDIKYFYDKYEEADLWGKDLYEHLDEIYRKKAKFCIMFLSIHYAKKLWTNHERKSAQAKAFQQHEEYILPVKLDDTEIPGIRPTLGYVDGRQKEPGEICNLIVLKVKGASNSMNSEGVDSDIIIPKVKRTISNKEKEDFLIKSFKEIQNFIESAIDKLVKNNSHVEAIFTSDQDKFTIALNVE